jgi:hypothetical protein
LTMLHVDRYLLTFPDTASRSDGWLVEVGGRKNIGFFGQLPSFGVLERVNWIA